MTVKSKKKGLISIITPCFNEEKSVEHCVQQVRKLFVEELVDYDYEHIFSDNCSTDKTGDILKALAAQDKNIKLIFNSRNFGPFRSMFNALRHSSGDGVITFLPVDLQDPPELIPEFVSLWESGYEVVAGARETREESYLMQRARSLFYRLVNMFADFEVPEGVGEFQLIDRKVANAVLQYDDKYPFVRGMIASVGFRRVIVPYRWRKRVEGKSKLKIFHLFDQAMNGIFSFSSLPMRLCITSGVVIASICCIYALTVVLLYLLGAVDAPKGTLTMIVSLFFLSGIQLLFIGVIGEYILSIHRQVRGGPVVVERELVNLDKKTVD